MVFGLFFDNNNLRRQLDSDTATLSLVNKGVGTASQVVMPGGGPGTTKYVRLTFSGRTAPMLAVGVDKPTQGEKSIQVVQSTVSGTTWTFDVVVWHQYGTDFAFRWYLFDVPYNTTLTGFGFAFWDEQGRLTANSNVAPMRTVSSMTSGRLYAAIHVSRFILVENWWWDTTAQQDRVDWQLSMDGISTYPGAAASSGFIDGGTSFNGPTVPWPNSPNAGPAVSILVDVTGL